MSYFRKLLPITLLSAVACGSGPESGPDNNDKADTSAANSVFIPAAALKDAQVLTMNEDALAAKLRVIDAAKQGDSLDLVYFIFSDDESSMYMASRIIAAVHRGVKVRVLLDYITNIGRSNLYRNIKFQAEHGDCSKVGEDKINPGCLVPGQGATGTGKPRVDGGSLDFAFYNPPDQVIHDRIRYLLTPCTIEGASILSAECTEDREDGARTYEAIQREELFITGLFGKNQVALAASLAAAGPQYAAATAAPPDQTADEAREQQEALARGMSILWAANVKDDPFAQLATFFLADQLKPLEDAIGATGALSALGEGDEWDHLTDFIHQKLTLLTPGNASEPTQLVLGGRNVENSYHVSSLPSTWAEKYIFLDVDMYASFQAPAGETIQDRFSRIWNFTQMISPLKDRQDDGALSSLKVDGQETIEQYNTPYTIDKVASFLEYYNYENGVLTAKERGGSWPSETYKTNKAGQLPIFEGVTAAGGIRYVENIPNPVANVRTFGTGGEWGNEAASGKYIQATWLEALNDICANGNGEEVVFQNAYMLFPTRMQERLTKALRKPETCPGVAKFTLITNSKTSTDLNIINIYNEPYIKPLLDNAATCDSGTTPCLEYYEYTTDHVSSPNNEVKRSLHAKVMIFGNDIFIGSSNADGRSEFMDANNGAFLLNAKEFVDNYKAWLKGTILPTLAAKDPRNIKGTPIEKLIAENMQFFETYILERYIEGDDRADSRKRLVESSTKISQELYLVSDVVMMQDPQAQVTVKIAKDKEAKDPKTAPKVAPQMSNAELMALVDHQLQTL